MPGEPHATTNTLKQALKPRRQTGTRPKGKTERRSGAGEPTRHVTSPKDRSEPGHPLFRWALRDSNPRPPPCKGISDMRSAHPTKTEERRGTRRSKNEK